MEFGSPIVMFVGAAVLLLAGLLLVVLLAVLDEVAGEELLEVLQPDMTADAITTPATQPGSMSVGLI
ncbi:MAG: hypothetical protein ACRDNO_29110 [Trebonia sp.]